ncbi:MAG TPA: hypothetical protein VJS39_09795 [Gemmatimonadaceae bacterium]|nr:hypothetical protein [Gemmatimonadaceae bacterium]
MTVTDATAAGVTVRVALPVLPSLVAVIFAVPGATAVTTPVADTVAIAELSELQVIMRPDSTLPAPSRSVAVACEVPIADIEFGVSATETVATGATATLIEEVADLPSLVAVIVAEPAACAVTSPLASTDATLASLDDQVTARPVRTFPPPSRVSADSC